MSYLEFEQHLKNGIRESFFGLDDELTIEIFNVTRTIDWPAVFSNPDRTLKELGSTLSDTIKDFITRLTVGLVARYPEFRKDTIDNLKLIECIIASVSWISDGSFKFSTNDEYMKVDDIVISDILANSPNLIVLYMLSNLTIESMRVS